MTTQITQLEDTLVRDQGRIAARLEQARTEMGATQEAMIKGLQAGHALSTGNVERLLEQEQVTRVWAQVSNLSSTASDTQELKARLEEWMRDTTEQVMAPGRSHSTSLVRTAQMMAEEDGLKSVARIVERIISNVGQ